MKITILGAGNAGCMSLLHFYYYQNYINENLQLELIYDKNIDPVPVGQGTNVASSDLIWRSLDINILSKNSFSFTPKHGILYENWGKKQKDMFHPFPFGRYAYHQDPAEFQKFVLKNVKNVKIIDTGLKKYTDIDSDFIVDCTGTPKSFKKYHKLINPLNHVLLSTLPYESYEYTKTTATPDGWCFQIPLKDKVSLGYNFNSKITSIKQAKKNFKNIFGVNKIHKDFSYNQYLAKEPISKDGRVCLNGNKLFFLEPLEATAISCYVTVCQHLFDWLFLDKKNKDEINYAIKEHMYRVERFILLHYANGSKYNTKFWSFAKNTYDKNTNQEMVDFVEISKKYKEEDGRNVKYEKIYAQWPTWSVKMWYDYVN